MTSIVLTLFKALIAQVLGRYMHNLSHYLIRRFIISLELVGMIRNQRSILHSSFKIRKVMARSEEVISGQTNERLSGVRAVDGFVILYRK